AQMDRFFIKLSLGYPTRTEELEMLSGVGDKVHFEKIQAVSSTEELCAMQEEIRGVHLDDSLKEYFVEIVQKTRESKALKTGASPRASRCLYQGSKALAAVRGRDYVTPDDIQDLLIPVLSHRIQLSSEARYSGKTAESVLSGIIESVEVPPKKEKMF
ncbi:MAG: MoxR family ATPase, partial [Spirochaetales bacterium]|nr:MoxR family ATPase [Candidatus Physcosoma equi]